jgi:phage gp36-like protein
MYATLEELTERFGERMLLQLTDRASPPAGAIDQAIVDRALADADAVIDGYLAGRYQLPLSEVPPLVVDLAQVVAIYKLHPFEPDPKISKDYDQALKTLREIAQGVVRLPAAGIEPAAVSSSGVKTNDRERPFTEDNLKGFV